MTAFQDVYDSPVVEIAKQLDAWARWGHVYGSPASAAAVTDDASSLQLPPESPPVRFPRLISRHTGALRRPAMVLSWVYPPLTLALVYLIDSIDLPPVPSLILLVAAALSMFGVIGALLLAIGGRWNYLEVTESGLVYR